MYTDIINYFTYTKSIHSSSSVSNANTSHFTINCITSNGTRADNSSANYTSTTNNATSRYPRTDNRTS